MASLDNALELLGVSTPFVYAGATYWLFHWLDESASDQAKIAISSVLKIKDYNKPKVGSALVEVFDRAYTGPLWHWRAFARSLIVTLVVSALYVFETYDSYEVLFEAGYAEYVAIAMVSALIVNILSDYTSLFAIRKWLVASDRNPVAALAIGMFIGAGIVLIASVIRMRIMQKIDDSFETNIVANIVWWRIVYRMHLIVPGLFVFAWLPLLALSLLALRAAVQFSWAVDKTQWFLKSGKDHPLDAIGCVAAAIVFLLTVLWQVFFKTSG